MLLKLSSRLRYLFLIFLWMSISNKSQTQDKPNSQVLKNDESLKFIFFEPDDSLKPRQIFTHYKEKLGLSRNHQFRIEKIDFFKSPNYMKYRYLQYYKGFQIPKAYLKIITRGRESISVMGIVAPNLNLDMKASLDESTALNIALSKLKENYKLSKLEEEHMLKTKPELMIYLLERASDQQEKKISYHAVYKYIFFNKTFYVDIHTGSIVDYN